MLRKEESSFLTYKWTKQHFLRQHLFHHHLHSFFDGAPLAAGSGPPATWVAVRISRVKNLLPRVLHTFITLAIFAKFAKFANFKLFKPFKPFKPFNLSIAPGRPSSDPA